MRVADFDFELPPENIALRPFTPREAAKLLVVKDGAFSDFHVGDLPSQLRRGDLLVFNDTKVIPAALSGMRIGRLGTTPKIEALLHLRLDGARWKAFAKPAKKLEVGDTVLFAPIAVIPAPAFARTGFGGNPTLNTRTNLKSWIPAFAGMTTFRILVRLTKRQPQLAWSRSCLGSLVVRHASAHRPHSCHQSRDPKPCIDYRGTSHHQSR